MPTVERHHSRTKPQLPSPPKRRLTTSRASGRFAYAKYLAQGDKVPLEQVTELADPDPAPIAEWYMPPGPPRFSSGARASAPTGKANRHRQGNRAGLEGRAGGDFEQVRRRRHRSPRPRRRAAVNSSPYLDVPPPLLCLRGRRHFPWLGFSPLSSQETAYPKQKRRAPAVLSTKRSLLNRRTRLSLLGVPGIPTDRAKSSKATKLVPKAGRRWGHFRAREVRQRRRPTSPRRRAAASSCPLVVFSVLLPHQMTLSRGRKSSQPRRRTAVSEVLTPAERACLLSGVRASTSAGRADQIQ